MFFQSLFILLTTFSHSLASCVIAKRIDLDGNGIPDYCISNSDGSARCLRPDGSWTTVITSTAKASRSRSRVLKTTAAAVSVTVSPSTTSSTTTTVGTTTVAMVPSSIKTTLSTLSVAALSSVSTMNAAGSISVLSSSSTVSALFTSTILSSLVSTTTAATVSSPSVSLPPPAQFKSDNGTKWTIEYVGDIGYTDVLTAQGLNGDKCRTGKIGSKVIWNCGDMECTPDWTVCGFAYGPAFYGTDSVLKINTDGIQHVQDNNFLQPWSGDPTPVSPQWAWGMDTSNVAPINDTHGVAYGWEIWRGAPDGSYVDRGNAVGSITLGDTKPIATRLGPLLTGPEKIQLGLLAILRDGPWIYIYSQGGPSNLIVTRVAASDDVFDESKYSSLQFGTDNTWLPAIPNTSDTSYGMTTANGGGKFGCAVYGSIFFNTYLNKYVIVCNIYMYFTNMYTSDTPYGPWSAEYGLLSGWNGYGSMAHPEYGNGNEFYFSQGPNSKFNTFKVTFHY